MREKQKIPARSIVVGVSGKIIGQITEDQWREFEERAVRYNATARRHVDGRVDPRHAEPG